MIVGRAIYRDGRRVEEPDGFAAMASTCAADGGIAWIGLYRPTRDEFAAVTDGFALHELAVEDAVKAHQRAKLERYGDTLFCVLRPARYEDATETVEFGEVHVFAGPHFVITVRHGEAPDLPAVRRALERRPDLLRRGSVAVAARDHGSRRGRLRAGGRRHRERHRRDRGRGVRDRKRQRGVAPDLRAHARGHRLPAGVEAARRDARPPHGGGGGRRGGARPPA